MAAIEQTLAYRSCCCRISHTVFFNTWPAINIVVTDKTELQGWSVGSLLRSAWDVVVDRKPKML